MAAMLRYPRNQRAFDSHGSAYRERDLQPARCHEALVSEQTMKPDGEPVPCHNVQNSRESEIEPSDAVVPEPNDRVRDDQ